MPANEIVLRIVLVLGGAFAAFIGFDFRGGRHPLARDRRGGTLIAERAPLRAARAAFPHAAFAQ
jgi:hypothetical protein